MKKICINRKFIGMALIFCIMIIRTGLCVFASAGVAISSDDEETLRKALAKYTQEPVLNFIYDDFDGNGTYEAVAFVGVEEEDESYYGMFYFVNQNGVTAIRNYKNGYWSTGEIYCLGGEKLIALVGWGMNYNIGYYYQVKGTEIVEIAGSGYGSALYEDEDGRLCRSDSQYDATVDFTGHTWNTYYFYWDDGLKEYGGTQITAEELSAYSGADVILNRIVSDGYTITSVYIRKNGIININACNGEWNVNVRAIYQDGRVEVAPLMDDFYEEGIIYDALNPEIAVY